MNPNRINPSGAMPANAFEDENKAKIREQLLKHDPFLKYNAQLGEMVDAIWKGSAWGEANAQYQGSDAVRNDGQLHGSDAQAEPGDEFFNNMEGFRKSEMGNKNIFPETSDPDDERYFGLEQELKNQTHKPMTELGGALPESNEPGLEAGQVRPQGVQSLETKAGAPSAKMSVAHGRFRRRASFYGR